MKTRFWNFFVIALILIQAISPVGALAYSGTDQPDYAPGAAVTIHGDNSDGAGFAAGEAVHVDISGPNAFTSSCDAIADENAVWSCQVTLPTDAADGTYSYVAIGKTPGISQSGEFSVTTPLAPTPEPTVEPTATAAPDVSVSSIIVRLAAGLSPEQQQQVIERNGGVETSAVPVLRLHFVNVPTETVTDVLANYRADSQVLSAELDKPREAGGTPTDPSYAEQWALPKIGWDSVYGTLTPAGTATLAILDTGIDASHPDLNGLVLPGYSVFGTDPLTDPNGHGTSMAGIAAAATNNEIGIAGVAYSGVKLLPVQVLGADGTGLDSDIITGIVWAVDNKADVILMAFSNPGYSPSLQLAIDYAWDNGVVLVAATGNEGVSTPTFPAGDRGVVGVSATDSKDALVLGSNYGTDTFLAAPGVDIFTTNLAGGYTTITGTSASAAMVAGAAAIIKASDPGLSNAVIVGRLARNADTAGTQEETGNGRLNLARALEDSSTEPVKPAGASPVGSGGPFVGPYVVAAAAYFSINDVTMTEGNNGTTKATFSVGWFRYGPGYLYPPFYVNYNTADSTAVGGSSCSPGVDYIKSSGQLAFTNFNETAKPIDVLICGDALDENNETFAVNISIAYGNAYIYRSPGIGTINNDDYPPYMSINDVSVTEGSSGVTNSSLDVSLSNPSGKTVGVQYSLASSSTNIGFSAWGQSCPAFDVILNAPSGSLSFTPGETTKSIPFQVCGDTTPEPNEWFTINIYNATYASISDGLGQATIVNDDISNSPPVALNMGSDIWEDTASSFALGGYDTDGDMLSFTVISGPEHGSISSLGTPSCSVSGGVNQCMSEFTYTPNLNYNGTDLITYKVNDGKADSANATYSIMIKALNDPPVALADNYSTEEDTVLTVPAPGVLGNDSDVDGDPLTVTNVYGPSRGTLKINTDGSFTYTPAANYSGMDGFSYYASDGIASSKTGVTISVNALNDPPILTPIGAKEITYGDSLTFTATASDPETPPQSLTFSLLNAPDGASIDASSGAFNWTPHVTGSYSATVRVCDDGTPELCADEQIEITIDQKLASVTAVDSGKIYGEDEPILITTNSGFLADDLGAEKITFSASRIAGETVQGSPYLVTPSASDNGTGLLKNYIVTYGTGNFTIGPALSKTVITCEAGPFIYDGSQQTPCSVSVTGAGGLNLTPDPVYTDNTGAGTATAIYTFEGDDNHTGSSDSKNFTIGQATSMTALICPSTAQTFTGSAVEPCSASYTTSDGLSGDATVTYTNNINVGTAHASAAYAGDKNHAGSSDMKDFGIGKAPSLTTVTASDAVYNGSSHGATASVTGAGSLNQNLPVTYTGNNGKIVFQSNRDGNNEIYVMNADGSGQTRLSDNSAEDTNPAWSPDGSQIVFQSNRDGNNEIYVMNADGSGQTRLTTNSVQDQSPTWSPDGTKITFARVTGYRSSDIYIMNADGSGQTKLTNNVPGDFPTFYDSAWSPDGTKILVLVALSDIHEEIYLMNTDGSGFAPLTNRGQLVFSAQWSPDGTKIVFGAGVPGTDFVYMMNADGSNQTLLTGNDNSDAAWSPEGAKLVFTSGRDGNGEIYVMNPDGSNQTRLTFNSSQDGAPSWPLYGTIYGPSTTPPTDAGSYIASAAFSGDDNHAGSSDSKSFTISRADSITAVTCAAGPFIYDGSPQTPCSVSVTGAGGLNLTPTPVYANNINAGTASASYTYAGDANHTGSSDSKTFIIGKAVLAVDAVGNSKSYGEDDPKFSYTLSGFTGSDNPGNSGISGSASCTRTLGESVADSPYTITCSPDTLAAPNYSFVSGATAGFTIGQASSTTFVTCSAGPFIYDGTSQQPCSVLVTGQGGLNLTFAPEYADNVNAGKATASFTYPGDENHLGSSGFEYFTINRAELAINAVASDKTYGALDPSFNYTLSGFQNGENATSAAVTGSASCSRTDGESVAGSPYIITCEPDTLAAPNYKFVTGASAEFNIGRKIASVTPAATGKIYGSLDPIFTGTLAGFLLTDGVTATYSRTSGETVLGSPYKISATLSPAGVLGNYDITYNTASFTITPKSATIAADNKGKTYGDDNPELTAIITGLIDGDVLEYALDTTASKFSNVGPYPITVTLGDNPNYDVEATDGMLSIGPKAAAITANDKSKIYGETNPALTATIEGTVNGDVLSYSLTTTAEPLSDVGSYPILVTVGSNPNYSITPANGLLSVGQKIASVSANDKNKTYGDKNPSLTATVVGEVAGGDAIVFTLDTPASTFSNIGPYPIVVALGANPNYKVTSADGILTINPKIASVTAEAKTKTYGDDNPALSAKVVGQVDGGDAISYSLDTIALKFSNVGPYPIVVTLGENPNYSLTSTDGILTIKPKAATVTAEDKSKSYGDENPELTAKVTGTVNGDTLDYLLATDAEKLSNVGPYSITVTLGTNPNYDVTSSNGILKIGQKAATVTANPKSKVYGEDNPAVSATVVGAVEGGDAIVYSLSTPALKFSTVGQYPIEVELGSNPNYSITPSNSLLTINPADTTTVAANKSASFGDSSITLTATVTANSPSAASVNEGTVTFVVKQGSTTLATLTSATVSDGAASVSLALGPSFVAGTYEIFATYNPAGGVPNFNGSSVATPAKLTIQSKTTTLAITQPASTQYSDPIILTATVSPASLNGQTITGSVEFFIDGTSVGSAAVNSSGLATLTNIPNFRAPAGYSVTAKFTSTNQNFTDSSAGPVTLTVTKEDARAYYTGNSLFWGATSTSSSANVTLSATIKDITAVVGDSAADPSAGDIRNAKVTFLSNGSPVSGCSNLSVSLVNSSDVKIGTVACNAIFSIGSTGATQYTIGIQVNNYYTRNHSDDSVVITVAQPLTSYFITGGGYLVLTSSSGQYAGDANSKTNYGFNVKYNKSGTNLQGNVNIIFRSGGKVYQIKSNSLQSLGVTCSPGSSATLTKPCTASFVSKANLTNITNPTAPISLGGNLTLQLQMTDKGEPGSADSLALALYDGSQLLFSSNWNGTKTIEQILSGGNLVVH